jgi:hypothetical protein
MPGRQLIGTGGRHHPGIGGRLAPESAGQAWKPSHRSGIIVSVHLRQKICPDVMFANTPSNEILCLFCPCNLAERSLHVFLGRKCSNLLESNDFSLWN